MGNKLYVGNLAYSVRDESLHQAFAQFGTVTSAKVMMDRETGRSKGFGFVEMASDAEAQAAINGMNGQALEGRAIVVNVARPREERPGGFGGGGGLGGLFGLSAEGDADAWAGAPGETAPLGEPLSARAGMTMQTNITFNVSALDGASVRNVIAEQAPQIAEIVGNAAQRSAAYRRRLNGL